MVYFEGLGNVTRKLSFKMRQVGATMWGLGPETSVNARDLQKKGLQVRRDE